MEGNQIPKSKVKKHPPLPRLLSKEVTHKCTCKSRSSPIQTGRRAFELAQEYSISNSRLALGSALFLGSMLALNQIQGASAADFTFTDEGTLVTAVGGANSDVGTAPTRIIFDGAAGRTITADGPVVFTDRAVSIGSPISSTFTLTAASSFVGNCLICSNSNLTLNNVVLDVAPKAGVSAISVDAAAPVTVILNNVEVKNVSGAAAITVTGQAETTVTINDSNIHNNTAAVAPNGGGTGGSVIVISAGSVGATVTLTNTAITTNTAGAGLLGGDGGSVVAVSAASGDVTVSTTDVTITGNTAGAGTTGSGGDGGSGGSVVVVNSTTGAATVTLTNTDITTNVAGLGVGAGAGGSIIEVLSLIHISEPTRPY